MTSPPKRQLQLWEEGDDPHWGWLYFSKWDDKKQKNTFCKIPYQQKYASSQHRCSVTRRTWMTFLFHANDSIRKGHSWSKSSFQPTQTRNTAFSTCPFDLLYHWQWPIFYLHSSPSIFLLPSGKLWRAMVDHSGQWWVFDGLRPWHLG